MDLQKLYGVWFLFIFNIVRAQSVCADRGTHDGVRPWHYDQAGTRKIWFRCLNSFEKSTRDKSIAVNYFLNNPDTAIKGIVLGYAHSFANLNTRGIARALGQDTNRLNVDDPLSMKSYLEAFLRQRGFSHFAIAALVIVYLAPFYISSVHALFLRFAPGLGVLLIRYFILLGGIAGTQRFLIPALPFMAIFSASR